METRNTLSAASRREEETRSVERSRLMHEAKRRKRARQSTSAAVAREGRVNSSPAVDLITSGAVPATDLAETIVRDSKPWMDNIMQRATESAVSTLHADGVVVLPYTGHGLPRCLHTLRSAALSCQPASSASDFSVDGRERYSIADALQQAVYDMLLPIFTRVAPHLVSGGAAGADAPSRRRNAHVKCEVIRCFRSDKTIPQAWHTDFDKEGLVVLVAFDDGDATAFLTRSHTESFSGADAAEIARRVTCFRPFVTAGSIVVFYNHLYHAGQALVHPKWSPFRDSLFASLQLLYSPSVLREARRLESLKAARLADFLPVIAPGYPSSTGSFAASDYSGAASAASVGTYNPVRIDTRRQKKIAAVAKAATLRADAAAAATREPPSKRPRSESAIA